MEGRCLCGKVRYRLDAAPLWQMHCHCESCRRACAAPFTSFLGVRDGSWSWTGEIPALYESAPGVQRSFCAHCGTQMSYAADRWPDETHFYAATLDDPDAFLPTAHVHHAERLEWIHLADDLPRHSGTNS